LDLTWKQSFLIEYFVEVYIDNDVKLLSYILSFDKIVT
jgi:hypothetical protein